VTPRPYQIAGRNFLAARRHALLADQMRVGKTPQSILAADVIKAERVLVLCPAIATVQWQSEWAAWSPQRPPAVIVGREPPRTEGVVISSYKRAVEQHLDALTALPPWDVVIVDEAHFAKNPIAARTKAIYGKGGIGWNAHRLWALSGTPAPNHAGELWPMLKAFGTVKCSYTEFVQHYCYYDWAKGRVFGNKRQHLPELRKLLEQVVMRRTRAEVAPDMPPIGYSFLNVEPTKGVDLPSANMDTVGAGDRIAVAMAKVPTLAAEIIQCLAAQDYEQTVVFGFHLAPLDELREYLAAIGISVGVITGATPNDERQRVMAAFRMGLLQVVLAQILAAGTAIDLSAALHCYFLELSWSPADNSQAASRLVNLQTRAPVTADIVSWHGTVDDAVQRTLMRKTVGAVFGAG